MSDARADRPSFRLSRSPGPVQVTAWAAIYWAAVLLALEPGNLLAVLDAGQPLHLGEEAARICGASLLGSASGPVVLALVRRFPIVGPDRWRHAVLTAFAVAGLTAGLIGLSCLLAGLGPFNGSTDLGRQLQANGALVALCICGLVGVAHALRPQNKTTRDLSPGPAAPASAHLSVVRVSTRNGALLLPVAEIDWVETQGNYIALHAGSTSHLVRDTLARLEPQLDPRRFVRVHRRALVALDRVREIKPLKGGDAEVRLSDGTRLRLSRTYRAAVSARLSEA